MINKHSSSIQWGILFQINDKKRWMTNVQRMESSLISTFKKMMKLGKQTLKISITYQPGSTGIKKMVTLNTHTVFCQLRTSLMQLTFPNHLLNVRSEEHTSELQSRGHIVC